MVSRYTGDLDAGTKETVGKGKSRLRREPGSSFGACATRLRIVSPRRLVYDKSVLVAGQPFMNDLGCWGGLQD